MNQERPARLSWTQALVELQRAIEDDHVSNGAAALAFYLMLSIFPMAISLLTLLPYLHIPNLEQAILDLLHQTLPTAAADLFTGTVQSVLSERHGGLLSFGVLLAVWSASRGMYALVQQLNITYGIRESRPYWKVHGLALLLLALFGVLVVGAFGLVVFGGVLEGLLARVFGLGAPLRLAFSGFRWLVIGVFLLLAFSLIYYFGPDTKQRFRLITPGAVGGVLVLGLASLGFRYYVSKFARLSATYGSLGAVIALLLWLYVTGLVFLVGAEVNRLVENHRSPGGLAKEEPPHRWRHPHPTEPGPP
jgi:membrane protein